MTPVASPSQTVSASPNLSEEKIQYVLLTFDGSYDLDMWEKSLEFARLQEQRQAPVHFTYFVSGVYFLPYKDRYTYVSPQGTGISSIGFAGDTQDVENRIYLINKALNEGHAIGAHANGHFDGSRWSMEQWNNELKQFETFLQNAQSTSGFNILSRIHGFRAPNLAINQAMYNVLASRSYSYDSSIAFDQPTLPYKSGEGIWEFPLARIAYNGDYSKKLIAMDYNFFVRQTNAQDILVRDTPQWNQFYEETVQSYRDYFYQQYNENRIPITIGNHFSLWNDGLYWDALKQFAYEVCGKSYVKCVTFEEVISDLNNNPL